MQVEIVYNPALGGGAYDVYFMDDKRGRVALPVDLVWQEADEGARIDPTLTLVGMDAHALFQALANTLDQKGYRPDSLAQMQGTMEAQKYHLEDMRRLAFPPDDIRAGDPS